MDIHIYQHYHDWDCFFIGAANHRHTKCAHNTYMNLHAKLVRVGMTLGWSQNMEDIIGRHTYSMSSSHSESCTFSGLKTE